ncbi:MAG: acyltransferase [Candidatus Delongbacteria bacterium]|jgi:acetyltransferase-like isoleucine patch superfamily enzyme|nr:acyltransferase [Candidatus Delongbacteria bacterium]
MKRLFRLISKVNLLFYAVYAKMYPVKYAKYIGVNIKGKVNIYCSSFSMFSTEPWLITLGNNVHITNGVKFINHDGGTLILRKFVPDLEITKPITVGNDVYIGINTIIMPGVNIGNNVIVGAGAVVTRDIPDNSIAVGVPAKRIKSVDEYLEKAKKESLHIGHLTYKAKEKELRKIFGIEK